MKAADKRLDSMRGILSEFLDTTLRATRTMSTLSVLEMIRLERERQDKIWGRQDHEFTEWLAIFEEELGEACKARNEDRLPYVVQDELVQAAAVLVAWIEAHLRRWPDREVQTAAGVLDAERTQPGE